MPREAKDAAMCTFESVRKSDRGEDLNLNKHHKHPTPSQHLEVYNMILSPSPGTFEKHASDHTSSNGYSAENGNTHQTFLSHLIIDQTPQTACL